MGSPSFEKNRSRASKHVSCLHYIFEGSLPVCFMIFLALQLMRLSSSGTDVALDSSPVLYPVPPTSPIYGI
jgi:hypothetical protein